VTGGRVVAVTGTTAALADADTPEGREIGLDEVAGQDAWIAALPGVQVTGATVLPLDALAPDARAAFPGLAPDAALALTAAIALHALARDGRLAEVARERPADQALTLRRALPHRATPPRLKNDCFAMPQGIDWVPVDDALDRLRGALRPITGTEPCPVMEAAGRVLAQNVVARRGHPPAANSAVDGYGFAGAAAPGAGPHRLPLAEGRAAAGQPFDGAVPKGMALRILTGAALPPGVDTVVLEEDVAIDGAAIVFDGPLKAGANTRAAGEDVKAEDLVFLAGHRLLPPGLALLGAVGLAEVEVHRRLRVGVLSTGDEIVAKPGAAAAPHQIWDANRPMLLALIAGWGYEAVDFGHVGDDADAIAARFDAAAGAADVLITSGGASAGDEDHVSALLQARGTLSSWRIALKPGRPLALALWDGMPVIGVPGNPVAALVCTLIFARPALSLLAGAGWAEPQGFMVPAAFSKRKKPGRREYLRARLTPDGTAEVFASEGSGRISGLSWATGLVELPDGAMDVAPGTPVRFLPYSGFGIT
jgi:molybdopterin molybdotransferase